MYEFKHSQTPSIFNNVFEKPDNKYPTQFSEINYKQKKFSLTSSTYSNLSEHQKSGMNS